MLQGIDIAGYQGSPDFTKVVGDGFRFCFVKASEGTRFEAKTYKPQIEGAANAGLFVGAYHFARPGASKAKEQAVWFKKVAGPVGARPGELPPVLDIEEYGGLPPALLFPWILELVAETRQLWGKTPIIYTGYGYWRHAWDQAGKALQQIVTEQIKDCPLWAAQYSVNAPWDPLTAKYANKRLWAKPFGPWSRWTFWQYSGDNGLPVAGVKGACDRNLFDGSEDDLRVLCGMEPTGTCAPGPAFAGWDSPSQGQNG